jgi:P27 family predicted phage terminase small subunit
MRRGRKPDPGAVKEAKGNPGKRRVAKDTAVALAATGGVEPPVWLKDEGLKVWARLAPNVVRLKLLTPVDAEAFGRYCRNLARWLKMQKRLDEVGEIYVIETASGEVRRPDPSFIIADRIERQLLAAEAVFGLNPAERQRIFASRTMTPDPAGDLFGRREVEAAQPVAAQAKPAGPVGLLN